MREQGTKLNFEGETIYIGIDTHKKDWKVALYHKETSLKAFTQAADPDLLVDYLERNYPKAHYSCAYEAGFCGFWIQKALSKRGVECIIANPADVPTTNKEKEFKTDPRDCRKIARSLRSNMLDAIYVPTDQGLESRHVVRLYQDMVKNRTRYKNKIKSVLNFYGINYPEEFEPTTKHWSKAFFSWLKEVELAHKDGTWYFRFLVDELERACEQVKLLRKRVSSLSKEEVYSKRVGLLCTIPGIALITAMTILTEIEDINRFKSLDKLCGYFGVVPKTNSSGDNERIGEITKRGNKRLKSAIIESAWVAIRHEPLLFKKYIELSKRMDGNKAIIRIARKLIARVLYVLVNEKLFELKNI